MTIDLCIQTIKLKVKYNFTQTLYIWPHKYDKKYIQPYYIYNF